MRRNRYSFVYQVLNESWEIENVIKASFKSVIGLTCMPGENANFDLNFAVK